MKFYTLAKFKYVQRTLHAHTVSSSQISFIWGDACWMRATAVHRVAAEHGD